MKFLNGTKNAVWYEKYWQNSNTARSKFFYLARNLKLSMKTCVIRICSTITKSVFNSTWFFDRICDSKNVSGSRNTEHKSIFVTEGRSAVNILKYFFNKPAAFINRFHNIVSSLVNIFHRSFSIFALSIVSASNDRNPWLLGETNVDNQTSFSIESCKQSHERSRKKYLRTDLSTNNA